MIVIVVCHDNLEYTKGFVEGVKRVGENMSGVKVVLVDNGSGEETREYLDGLKGEFDVVRNEKNEWFTVANKDVIDKYPGEDIYLVNNDVVVKKGWLSGRKFLKEYGAIGALQLSPQDERVITFAGGGDDFAGHVAMWEWRLPDKEIWEVSWLTGCGMMINRVAYDAVGGLDTGLKHYCQDSDISLRMIKAGYKIGVCKGMRIVHFGGQTTQAAVRSGNQEILKQGDIDQYNFARKHGVQCGRHNFKPAITDLKTHYDNYFNNDEMQLKNIEASRIEAKDLLSKFDWKGKKVLEIGCGFGKVVEFLQTEGVDAYGIDISETAVKRGGVKNVMQGDLIDFNEKYDVIFSKAVLEHVPAKKIRVLIKKIYDNLNEEGITHHNIDTEQGTDPTHVLIAPIDVWKNSFESFGFKTLEIKHLHGGIYWCTWQKIKLADGGADYFDKTYFEDGTKNGLKDSFNRYFEDGVNVANRLEKLIPEMNKDWKILEVGCAYGHTLKALRDKGYYQIRGADISQYSVDKGIKEFNIELFQKNIEKEELNVIAKNVDLVYSCITLEHIHEKNADFVVKNLAEVTKPDGYNYHAIDLTQGQDTTHYCIKSRQWWIDLFVKHGFIEIPLAEEQIRLNWFLFRRTK
jgi:hypothetical protein